MGSFPHDPGSYELVNLVGKGASSAVYEARCLTNQQTLAVKLIDLDDSPNDINYLHSEIAVWSCYQHPNIVPYYGSFVSGKALYVLMQYLSGGSIYDIIRHSFPNGFKDETVIATILRSIVVALAHIHRRGHIHRDIKPGNAIVGADGTVKIGDFGVAATLFENGRRRRARFTLTGTPCYMAPEILDGQTGYTEKVDVWSLGITAIELATGSAPYATMHEVEIVQRILKAPPPQLPRNGGFSSELRDFVRRCTNFDPRRRPSADDLLAHPFLQHAREPLWIVDSVLRRLPPLGDRFSQLHQNSACADLLEQNFNKWESLSLPKWNFHDASETPPVKHGRFTIKRQRPQRRVETPDQTSRIDRLTRKADALTRENEELRREIEEKRAALAELSEKHE
jgi:serine/threonine-protein kinase OSR1/STK39